MTALLAPWTAPRARDDRSVRPLVALGTMNFGRRTPEREAHAIIARAIERGVTLFDTANVYESGLSEQILGRALGGRRRDVVIASKVGLGRPGGKVEGLGRAAVLSACEGSLARLGTDIIDIYYLHAPDYATPIEETLDAVKTLLDRGSIRAFGVSNYASWQILEIVHLCDAAKMPRPVIAQQMYNLLITQLDVEYFKFARKHPIHTTAYNALAGGLLARPHAFESIPEGSRFDKNAMYQRRYWSAHFFAFTKALREIAEGEGMDLAALAYAWLADRPIDSVLVGPADVAQLDVAIDALGRRLSPESTGRIASLQRAFAGTDATYAR